MLLKLLPSILLILQNQEIQETVNQLALTKKADNLAQLVTLLSVALITVLILLSINLYKVHKLKSEIKQLKNN